MNIVAALVVAGWAVALAQASIIKRVTLLPALVFMLGSLVLAAVELVT